MAQKQNPVSNKLRDIREWRGYGVDAAANLVGFESSGTISKHERGQGLKHENLVRYANAYRVRISDITGETDFRSLDRPLGTQTFANPVPKSTLRRELEEIDMESIRWIRAWIARQPDAPNGVVMLESRAEEIREELTRIDNLYAQA